ncbi:MAG: hypothetical protein ACOH5I_09470 [Oligoflexus sp.]
MPKKKTNLNQKELLVAIARVNRDLSTLRDVKSLLAKDGIKPDEADKAKESKLIQRLIGYEKDLKRLKQNPSSSQARPEKFAKSKAKQRFGKTESI